MAMVGGFGGFGTFGTFGTWLDYDFPLISGMSSSQLTNSIIFQRGG